MKQMIKITLTALACLSVSGCSLFSSSPRMISVSDASRFVEEAFKTSMVDVAEKQLRPSQIALSFYADNDVNAILKQRKPPLKKSPVRLPQPGPTKTVLIKYSLKCNRTRSVTFAGCQVLDTVISDDSVPVPPLHFTQIQLRQNNRLNFSIEHTPKSGASSKAHLDYFLGCDRDEPSIYKQCESLTGQSSAADSKNSALFAIKQLQLLANNHLDVIVEQQVSKPRNKFVYQAPKQPETPWIASYVDPKPISFKVLMLRDDSLLLSADQESLKTDLEGTLGKNYIDHNDYVLTPGQFKFIDFARIDPDTRYLGIIADYRDNSRAVWKKVFKVEPTGSNYPLHVHLKRNEVDILAEEQ